MQQGIYKAFDDHDRPSIDIVNDCVHCGFCLSTCPTYLETRNELDSPRGRIHLIKSALDGQIPMGDSLVNHLDMCLGCLACETSCPSGVKYGSLLESGRAQIERRHKRSKFDRYFRSMIFSMFPYPARLKFMLPFFYVYQKSGLRSLIRKTGILGKISPRAERMEEMLPLVNSPRLPVALPELIPAKGKRRYRVAMLTGCVQSVFFSKTNEATARVLSQNGCDVQVPKNQECCGALSVHSGRLDEGREFAKSLIKSFEDLSVDALIINSAGCGSTVKEYRDILGDDPEYSDRARELSKKSKDVMEFLADIRLGGELKEVNLKVTYQDACHMGHGQKIKDAPRSVINRIPGLEFVELPESDLCCGSAGIYNMVQPEMSEQLLGRKMRNLNTLDGIDYIVTGNPGCLLQIQKGIQEQRMNIKIAHTVELLDWSYRGVID